MLKEITLNEFIQSDAPVYLLDTKTGTIRTVEDLFDGIRILKDGKVLNAETPESPKKKRRSGKEIEVAILKAWNGGERTISQVMELAHVDYKAARRYLPASKEG